MLQKLHLNVILHCTIAELALQQHGEDSTGNFNSSFSGLAEWNVCYCDYTSDNLWLQVLTNLWTRWAAGECIFGRPSASVEGETVKEFVFGAKREGAHAEKLLFDVERAKNVDNSSGDIQWLLPALYLQKICFPGKVVAAMQCAMQASPPEAAVWISFVRELLIWHVVRSALLACGPVSMWRIFNFTKLHVHLRSKRIMTPTQIQSLVRVPAAQELASITPGWMAPCMPLNPQCFSNRVPPCMACCKGRVIDSSTTKEACWNGFGSFSMCCQTPEDVQSLTPMHFQECGASRHWDSQCLPRNAWENVLPSLQSFIDEQNARGLKVNSVLDVGAGNGMIAAGLRSKVGPFGLHDVKTVDVADQQCTFMDPYTMTPSSSDLRMELYSDAGDLPNPEGGFDLIMFNWVLHHVANPIEQQMFIMEAARRLAPGGALHIAEDLSEDAHDIDANRLHDEEGFFRSRSNWTWLFEQSGLIVSSFFPVAAVLMSPDGGLGRQPVRHRGVFICRKHDLTPANLHEHVEYEATLHEMVPSAREGTEVDQPCWRAQFQYNTCCIEWNLLPGHLYGCFNATYTYERCCLRLLMVSPS